MKEFSDKWWQRGIIYHVYPRSFQDSDGNGVGDLQGVIDRLDYLAWLGVDAIWLSPFFPSPMADFGYDISDYTDIDPLFGDLETFDKLVWAAKAREIRIILDFVPNHTSSRHPWFLASRSSRADSHRDWYIWRDAAPGGGPPNNWLSVFGGSAWERDEATGQYYLHTFLREQPDLNWRNPEVRRAMLDVLRFWLRRGVDGFRIDVLWYVIKDEEFRDNPPNPDFASHMPPTSALLQTYSSDRAEVLEVVSEIRAAVDEYGDDKLLIAELYLPIERLIAYYGLDGRGAHLPMNFHLLQVPWNAPAIAALVDRYEAALPVFGWPNWVLGNHDQPRLASRIGPENVRLAAVLLMTLRGTPTMYYGDEIGLENGELGGLVLDPVERQVPGHALGRDPSRTPMQWDGSAFAGFSTTAPWLPLSADHSIRNVERQREDAHSLLSLYKSLIDLRRRVLALNLGAYRTLYVDEDLFAFERVHDGERWLILLNFSARTVTFPLKQGQSIDIKVTTVAAPKAASGEVQLEARQGIVARVLE